MAHYAIFARGQIWELHSSAGWSRGYVTRPRAVAAAVDALAADGPDASLLLHDETSYLAAPDLCALIGRGGAG